MVNEVPWVDSLSFGRVLRQTAQRHADRDALVFPQFACRRSYAQFLAEVEQVGRSLLALGVEPGEHVGIWATNRPEWVLLQFGVAQIGAVLVNINPAYRASELEYVLNQADITTLFLTERFKTSQFFDILESICPEVASGLPGGSGQEVKELQAARCPRLRRVISMQETVRPGFYSWSHFLALGNEVPHTVIHNREEKVQSGDVASIQYTSGTTGFPKGAMLTHRNLLVNAYHVGQRLNFTEMDRLCIPVPFYHCFGCGMGTLMCVIYGSAMVVPAESFDPLATLQGIQDEQCTGVYGVPTMFIAELNHPRFGEFDLKSLRTGIMAGSPCPIELMRAVVEKMGARELTIAYGLTEAAPVITQTTAHDSLEHRVGTVGQVIPGLEVRIVNPGTLDPLPQGHAGELVVQGHGNMKGYYKKPKETAEALTPDGWLHTGDVALQTPDGYYRITGRIKDMIIRGGENIYPREIEEYLYTHPQVADVQVVGLPDPKYGEEICAWIKLKAEARTTEEEIKDFCQGKIAHYKVPRYVIFVNEFPTTVTGKIQKFKLREMGIERLGLQQAARIETA